MKNTHLTGFIYLDLLEKRDGANGLFQFLDSVVAGYSENDSGVINGYLAKVNLQDGKLKWENLLRV